MHQLPRRSTLDGDRKAQRTKRVALTQHKIVTKSNVEGPASRTRSRKKRKLDELSPTPIQFSIRLQKNDIQGDEPEREDHQVNTNSWSNVPSKPWIPERRVLELILDVLQRRDTHEIFAEPVDPEEVEDYYEIIKEPMDFGTMRAKLHEGMYGSLEQFEHDIFLITKNAMHFNPSDTIYFRQARVVNELATKVFGVLKTHPERFELEFSESRLRNARRSQGEAGNLLHRTRPKPARNVKSNSMTIDESQRSMSRSFKALPNIRRRNGVSGPSSSFDAKEYEVPHCGGSDDRVSKSMEADKRYTYKPWRSSLDEDESAFSLMSSNIKQLEHIIQKDIGYSKSLMSFVKDLGPAVQVIARHKLFGPNIPIHNRSMTNNRSQDGIIIALPSQNFMDTRANATGRTSINGSENIKRTYVNAKLVTQNAIIASKFDGKLKNAYDMKSKTDAMIPSAYLGDQIHQSSAILSTSSLLAQAGESISGDAGFKNIRNKTTATLDQSTEQTRSTQVKAESEKGTTLDRHKPLTSHFTFEMPFLESRLGQQTNAFRRLAFLQQSSVAKVNFSNV